MQTKQVRVYELEKWDKKRLLDFNADSGAQNLSHAGIFTITTYGIVSQTPEFKKVSLSISVHSKI